MKNRLVPLVLVMATTISVAVVISMKRKRRTNSLKSEQQLSLSETKTTMVAGLYLPDECWKYIFKLIINDGDDSRDLLNSLSLVSKQFLSITDRLRFSLNVDNMKRKRDSLNSSHQTTMVAAADLYLPNECWECIIRFLDTDHRNLESLSLVSKHFLSITNNIRFSLTICDTKLPFLPRLFQRFPNLTSLDFTHFSKHGDLNALLFQISTSGITHVVVNAMSMMLPKLRKINLSDHYCINDSLLLHLCKNCEFLEEVVLFKYSSLTWDGIASAIRERPSLRSLSVGRQSNERRWWSNGSHDNISSHFTDSLVSLKGLTYLDLSSLRISDMFLSSIAIEGISLRRLVLQDCTNYSYSGIFSLLSRCQCIQHLDLQNADFLNNQHIFELSSFLDNLVSVNLSYCWMLNESTLFRLISNCPSLNEIKMESTSIGEESVENSNSLVDFVARPQLKYLYLAFNSLLSDESIKMFASIFPNLQLLDLSSCYDISDEGICQVLRRCKIRHLKLTYCLGMKMHGMNFEVPKLEVLNLSHTRVDDIALHVIAESCCGLLQLLLEFCKDVTEKGVKHVVKNCTQLREINLRGCDNVYANIVDMMVFLRPTLRKITAPHRYHFLNKKRELFSHHGCYCRISKYLATKNV